MVVQFRLLQLIRLSFSGLKQILNTPSFYECGTQPNCSFVRVIDRYRRQLWRGSSIGRAVKRLQVMFVTSTAILPLQGTCWWFESIPCHCPSLSVVENRRNMSVFFTANNFIGSNSVGAIMWCLQQLFWI